MILFGFLILYVLLIGILWVGYGLIKPHALTTNTPVHSFTIVIPFRNEAAHLPELLESVRLLHYPAAQHEILMVNDASSDNSVALIEAFILEHELAHIQLLENQRISGSPKKDAIRTAITVSQYDWLITTDADCILPSQWLRVLDDYIQKKEPNMIAGPLALTSSKATSVLLYGFETLDIHSLLAATIGAFGLGKPIMANGANLAYRKDIFHSVDGFDGNDHMASGDDLFLLEKFIAHDASAVHYLKSRQAIVRTAPQDRWMGLVNQRKRWAAKASAFNSAFAKAVGMLVLLGNIASIIAYGLLLYTYTTDIDTTHNNLIIAALLLKYLFDGLLLVRALTFTGSLRAFIWYPLVVVCYPFVTLTIAILAFTTSYTWKDRTFKQ
jgi:cellulose synthase/poly-beta-1,6-N-acetylglucosamine synthase-like glycosyltransferase